MEITKKDAEVLKKYKHLIGKHIVKIVKTKIDASEGNDPTNMLYATNRIMVTGFEFVPQSKSLTSSPVIIINGDPALTFNVSTDPFVTKPAGTLLKSNAVEFENGYFLDGENAFSLVNLLNKASISKIENKIEKLTVAKSAIDTVIDTEEMGLLEMRELEEALNV